MCYCPVGQLSMCCCRTITCTGKARRHKKYRRIRFRMLGNGNSRRGQRGRSELFVCIILHVHRVFVFHGARLFGGRKRGRLYEPVVIKNRTAYSAKAPDIQNQRFHQGLLSLQTGTGTVSIVFCIFSCLSSGGIEWFVARFVPGRQISTCG